AAAWDAARTAASGSARAVGAIRRDLHAGAGCGRLRLLGVLAVTALRVVRRAGSSIGSIGLGGGGAAALLGRRGGLVGRLRVFGRLGLDAGLEGLLDIDVHVFRHETRLADEELP